jgi:hypothetical protein
MSARASWKKSYARLLRRILQSRQSGLDLDGNQKHRLEADAAFQ